MNTEPIKERDDETTGPDALAGCLADPDYGGLNDGWITIRKPDNPCQQG